MIIGRSSTKYANRKSKMAATAIHRLTFDLMGKCSNAYFSETTYMITAKLYMNVHWMVLYNLKVFYSDMKFKMVATAETKLNRNDHWKVLYKLFIFYADRTSKMAATAIHRLTLDPMEKCSNAFFSETTNIIKAKLYMNVHWMVLFKIYVFCSDMKFKMASTAELSLTLDPMGKMFQNASSLKPLGQLKPNCPGMIIGRSSTKYANRKSKMAATAIHRLTFDPMGKCSNAYFSETTYMITAKLYMHVHWMVLYKYFVFVPI
jgi:hypothetical protein